MSLHINVYRNALIIEGLRACQPSIEATAKIRLTGSLANPIRIKTSFQSPDTKHMADLAILVIAIYCAASLFVGSRLMLLAWRTGKQPELFAAIALLGIAPFGFGLTVVSTILIPHSTLAANFLWAVAALSLNIGSAGAFLFSYRVFHSGNERIRSIVTCLVLLLASLWLAEARLTAFEAAPPASVATRISDWLRSAALLWGGLEALQYWTRLRRRVSIGLADPIVVRRFLLWGIALFGSGVCNTIDATTKLFVVRALDYPLLTLTNAVSGLLAAACLTFAFWPNRSTAPNPIPAEAR